MQFYGLLVSFLSAPKMWMDTKISKAASIFLALVILPLVKKRVYEVFLITYIGYTVTMIYGVW